MRPVPSIFGTASLVVVALAGTSRPALGQDETLLRGGAGAMGFYVAPVVKLTEIRDRSEVVGGIRAGVLFGRRFGVGLAAYSGGGDGRYGDPYYGRGGRHGRDPGLAYGGVELEYLWQPSKLVHATITSLIGGGSLPIEVVYAAPALIDSFYPPYGPDDRESFFVAEPAAHAEVNVARHVRLSFGLGYRFTAGGDRFSNAASNARGATGSLAIKFGKL